MNSSIRTKRFDLSATGKTRPLDLREGISETTRAVDIAGSDLPSQSRRTDLSQPCATAAANLAPVTVTTSAAGLLTGEQIHVSTTGMAFFEVAPDVSTRKIPLDKPAEPACRALRMFTTDVATVRSSRVDEMPQTRDMINLKYLNFPRISEYITRMAEDHGQSYSNIKLIGIYEPVPLHRAYNLKLDALTGRLTFHVRPEDHKAQKRFARVAYGRIRMSGEIVQTVYPVT